MISFHTLHFKLTCVVLLVSLSVHLLMSLTEWIVAFLLNLQPRTKTTASKVKQKCARQHGPHGVDYCQRFKVNHSVRLQFVWVWTEVFRPIRTWKEKELTALSGMQRWVRYPGQIHLFPQREVKHYITSSKYNVNIEMWTKSKPQTRFFPEQILSKGF